MASVKNVTMTSTLDEVKHHVRQRLIGSLGASPARVRVALILVVFGFITLASVVAVKTPPWQSSDEPEHVRNIETLVSGHWYGMNGDCRPNPLRAGLLSCAGDEAQQAPLYYIVLAAWQDFVGLPAEPPPQIYPDQGFLLWLRFANVVMGAATVVMTFFAARLIARDTWTPVIAAALVAFFPRFVFLSSFVTNDNLVILLGAALTFCSLRFSQRVTSGWMIATGVVFGLLLTTKLSVLPLALIVPLLALLAPTWRRRLWLLLCGCLSALAVSAWVPHRELGPLRGPPGAACVSRVPCPNRRCQQRFWCPHPLRREGPAPSGLRRRPQEHRHGVLVSVRLEPPPLVDACWHHHHLRRRCASLEPHPSTYFEASTPRPRRDLGAVVCLRLDPCVPDRDLPGSLRPCWHLRNGHPRRTRPTTLPNCGSLDSPGCRTRRMPDRDTSRCLGRSLDLSRSVHGPHSPRNRGFHTEVISSGIAIRPSLNMNVYGHAVPRMQPLSGMNVVLTRRGFVLPQGGRSPKTAFGRRVRTP